MAESSIFPAFVSLKYDPTGKVAASVTKAVAEAVANGNAELSKFGKGIDPLSGLASVMKKQVDDIASSLSKGTGADLGAAAAQQAAKAAQTRAAAASALAAAIEREAKATGDSTREANAAIAAAKRMAAQEAEAAQSAQEHAAALERLQSQLEKVAAESGIATGALGKHAAANDNLGSAARRQSQSLAMAGQQLQDIAIQAQMGTSAFTIAAQQGGQLGYALSGLAGSANKTYAALGSIGTFLAGPWGAGITIGLAVLGPLVGKLLELGDATDKAIDKLKKDAEETAATRQAKELFKNTVEGVSAAIRDQHAALEQQTKGMKSEAEQARDTAKEYRNKALSIRETTIALLEHVKAQAAAANSQTFGAAGGAGAGMAQSIYAGRVQEVEAALKRAREDLATAQKNLIDTQANFDVERGKTAADPVRSIEKHYDTLILQAKERAKAEGKVGDALAAQVQALEAQKRAAAKAAQESQRGGQAAASAANDLGNMVALIKQLFPGARITSTTNHSKYTADGNISDHYRERAIDFVPAGGMGQYSKAEVEQILKTAGINIRRNANGTEQFFGPGDKGHSDHFHVAWQGGAPDPDKVAAATQRAEAIIREFGERSAESIAKINDRFNEQPKLIDQAAAAARELDRIIADLSDPKRKQPTGAAQMIEDAKAAKVAIQDSLLRPSEELTKESQRQMQIQDLLSQGRDAEAAATQNLWTIEDKLGTEAEIRLRIQQLQVAGRKDEAAILQSLLGAYPQIRADVVATANAEQAHAEQLARVNELQGAYLETTRSIRSEVEGILGGYGKIGNLKGIFQQLQGKVLTEALFGDVFRDLEKTIKGQTGIGGSVDMMASETTRAGNAAGAFADAINAATASVTGAAHSAGMGATIGSNWALMAKTPRLLALPGGSLPANDNPQSPALGALGRLTQAIERQREYAHLTAHEISGALTDWLDTSFKTSFFKGMAAPLGGALEGWMTTGTGFGALLGGLKDLKGLPDKLSEDLGKAFRGAQTGTMVAGIGNAMGLNLSTLGSQVGGAIGGLIPIPGFDVLGSIAGGFIGKLFGKRPRGGGAVTQDNVLVHANDAGITDAMGSFGSTLQGNITKIAEALGAQIGSYSVGIGRYKDYYQVSGVGNDPRLGNSYFGRDSANALYDGKDPEAAMRAAIVNAIQDGAVQGIRDGALRLLKAGKDLDAQIQKAVDFQNVFKELKQIKDPVGAALDDLNADFTKLKATFQEAGASAQEMASLEELYGLKRAKAIKDANDQVIGSLKDLMSSLTIDNPTRSLREREAAALAAFNPLKARVQAGDATAYDEFAKASQDLLGLERQLYGSTQRYFDFEDQIKSITQSAINSATAVADAAANRDSPFSSTGTATNSDNASVTSAIDKQTNALVEALQGQLGAANDNLRTLIRLGIAQANASRSPAVAAAVRGNF